jgi:hypothetical protein
MKKALYLLFFTINIGFAQTVTIDPSTGNSGNINVSSINGGIVVPRMTSAQRTGITNPTQGLMVYQTDGTTGFYVNKSSIPSVPNWVKLTEGDNLWTRNIFSTNNIYTINSGNVGIGQSSPTRKLEVVSNSTTEGVAHFENTSSASNQPTVGLKSNGSNYTLQSEQTGQGFNAQFKNTNATNQYPAITAYTNGSFSTIESKNYGTVNGAGDFRIENTSNTGTALAAVTNGTGEAFNAHSSGAGKAANFRVFDTNNSADAVYIKHFGTGNAINVEATSGVGGYFTSSNGYALITGTGNVGIGTNTPVAKLHIGGSQSEKIRLENTNSLANGVSNDIFFRTGSFYTGAIKVIGTGTSTARMGLFTLTGPTTATPKERISILDLGNVGIGTTTPSEKLEINGNLKTSGEINRTQTTTANLVPIAYGSIDAVGSAITDASTDNFTITNPSAGIFLITVTSETINISNYTFVGTICGGSLGMMSLTVDTGKLKVLTSNAAGSLTNQMFSFVIYKK